MSHKKEEGAVQSEIVDMSELPVRGRSSQFDPIIAQAQELEPGQGLKVTSETNKHLRNTLAQLLKRKGITDVAVLTYNQEVYLKKI